MEEEGRRKGGFSHWELGDFFLGGERREGGWVLQLLHLILTPETALNWWENVSGERVVVIITLIFKENLRNITILLFICSDYSFV